MGVWNMSHIWKGCQMLKGTNGYQDIEQQHYAHAIHKDSFEKRAIYAMAICIIPYTWLPHAFPFCSENVGLIIIANRGPYLIDDLNSVRHNPIQYYNENNISRKYQGIWYVICLKCM